MNPNNTRLYTAILMAGCGLNAAAQSQRPNIVWIITDDHAFQTISAYGSEVSKLAPTPHIDRLAKEGVRFDDAFVENSLSTPARACLLTGLYSHQSGQRTLDKGIDTTKTFVSELLHDAGYQTAVVGKWHMQCRPKGFDFFRIFWNQGDYYNPAFLSHDSKGKYIREQGYAVENGEYKVGLRSVSAPVRDVTGEVRYAVGVVGMFRQVYSEDFLLATRMVCEAAAAISRAIGYRA